jgi:uncharacterized membrane protein
MLGGMALRRKDIALVVSISLNLFLIGAAVTIYALHQMGVNAPVGQRLSLRAAASNLDEGHKAAFMRLLNGQGRTIQAETRSAKAIRDQAWASMATANFDPAVTKRQLAQARALNGLARGTVEDAVIDFATGLTPTQREGFSQAMRRAAWRQRADSAKDRPNAP